ncbi:ROK family protein [Corynebacterium sp. USCH3]|uniref:polyphosphate--glucose phosphotransferase n=1 Tax=Corynebacterium sp. USCH3 TaxID=3024840 RepID=UPI0030978175
MAQTSRQQTRTTAFGIDIGGSGIKGALVNLDTGEFIGDRVRIDTPQPATPDAVADTVAELLDAAGWTGPVGLTVPAVVRDQVAVTAANIDPAWIGTDCQRLFGERLGTDGSPRRVVVLNDADAAGIAEARYGDASTTQGTVLFLTFGTGIGSALLYNGALFPNTELGHLNFPAMDAEKWASSAVREREKLSYKEWARRVDRVLGEYVRILNPARIIVGGGISKKHHKWIPELTVDADVVPAVLLNRAGIVGAAVAVHDGMRP